MSVLSAEVYADGRKIADATTLSDAISEARASNGMAWVSLLDPDQTELDEALSLLDMHPLLTEGVLRPGQRTKLAASDDKIFVALQPARYDDASEMVSCAEVDVFAGVHDIVTVQHSSAVDISAARERLAGRPEYLERGPIAALTAIIDEVIGHYHPVLDGIEHDIDEIEEQLSSTDPHVSKRIFALQREVIDLQHATSELPGILEDLERIAMERAHITRAPILGDLADRARHMVERTQAFRHALESALQVNAILVEQENSVQMRRMTEISLEQNDQVKKVSSWAAILFAPTLVGTVYGMNFNNMPELHWTYGYPMAIALMLGTSITLYTIFKRKQWL
ncbi:magnesium transporter [Microbacterium endophyticum]|uniref:Magnesium transporter n=1 Tax=Microbacterium endophyticum TaxID=1526412 RepID=A0A7W4YLV7_9MICO|nr:magnesium and cobalt transport protein CorA [Microbacterium endophyticum]MBB2974874.1 magnesium transporter [Microbacterium endophyticum]NIK37171.1 magnesium transporter [Microbacterium endophyticum]